MTYFEYDVPLQMEASQYNSRESQCLVVQPDLDPGLSRSVGRNCEVLNQEASDTENVIPGGKFLLTSIKSEWDTSARFMSEMSSFA